LTELHEPATVTIPEFARRFGIARSTAYALAQREALPVPVIRMGRRLVVSRKLLERVLAGQIDRITGCDE